MGSNECRRRRSDAPYRLAHHRNTARETPCRFHVRGFDQLIVETTREWTYKKCSPGANRPLGSATNDSILSRSSPKRLPQKQGFRQQSIAAAERVKALVNNQSGVFPRWPTQTRSKDRADDRSDKNYLRIPSLPMTSRYR